MAQAQISRPQKEEAMEHTQGIVRKLFYENLCHATKLLLQRRSRPNGGLEERSWMGAEEEQLHLQIRGRKKQATDFFYTYGHIFLGELLTKLCGVKI